MEKIKREDSGIIWVGIITNLVFGTIGLVMLTQVGFGWFGFLCWLTFQMLFIIGFGPMMKSDQHLETLSYTIYKYEKWDKENMQYDYRYTVTVNTLRARFTLNKYMGNYIESVKDKDIHKYITTLSRRGVDEHKSKESAMNEIYEDIKRLIKNEKELEMPQIKNVETLKTYSVEELKEEIKKK
jgi:hypothetical protein